MMTITSGMALLLTMPIALVGSFTEDASDVFGGEPIALAQFRNASSGD